MSADAVRARLAEWRTQGIGPYAVAEAAGIGPEHVHRIETGQYQRIEATTAEIILAASPAVVRVEPTRARRQLRALMYAGHSSASIAADCRTTKQHIVAVARGLHRSKPLRWITPDLTERVAACWERKYAEDGGDRRAHQHAVRSGWLPGDAWDESTIGDPDALPWQHMDGYVDPVAVEQFCDGGPVQLHNRDEIDAAFRMLHGRGWSDVQIGERFGKSPDWALKRRQALGLAANQTQARSKRGSLAVYLTRRVQRYRGRAGLRHPDELVRLDARTSLADLAVAFAAAGLPWPAEPAPVRAVTDPEPVDLSTYDTREDAA